MLPALGHPTLARPVLFGSVFGLGAYYFYADAVKAKAQHWRNAHARKMRRAMIVSELDRECEMREWK